jgi:hypothetical protein
MKKILIIILLFAAGLFGCTEKVDIPLDDTFTRLVVEGAITTDTTTHFIKLSTTTSYYFNQEPPAVENAIVTITDSEGNQVQLTEELPGVYTTGSDFYAVQGRTYTLDIFLEEEINGYKEYQATSSVPQVYPIDSIGLAYRPEWGDQGFIEVQCYYQDPFSKDFYMFDIYKNGDHLTDTITNRFVTDDSFYNGSYTNGIGVGWLNQGYERERVYPNDTITFRAASITEEYANFIWTLQEEVGFSTPLFSGPPANVKSNVNNGAVGFFAAYSVEYAETIATPQLFE